MLSGVEKFFNSLGILQSKYGGTGVDNGSFNLTVPATGTANLIGTAQTVSARKTHTATDIFTNMLRVGTSEVIFQDATPATRNDGTALVADDLWYETDTNIIWYWDGTYWLSMEIFQLNSRSWYGDGGTQQHSYFSMPKSDVYDFYIETLYGSFFVLTTNDGTNYWTIDLNKIDSGLSATRLGGFDTSTTAVSTLAKFSATVNTLLDLTTNIKALEAYVTPIAFPGEIYGHASTTYRLRHR